MPRITPQPSRILVKFFERHGFSVSKRKPGDHIAMRRDGCPRPVIIPDKKAVPVGIILSNLRTAGIDRDRYLTELPHL